MTAPIPVYVDCDTGIDDALALAYLLAEPSVRVVGVGTVSGNTSAEQAAINTIALLEAAGRADIPVAVGRGHFRTREFAGGARAVHGGDGVGGLDLTAETPIDGRTALELLATLTAEHPGLQVLALGPLTNLAEFVERRPDLVGSIERVVVMGGAFDHRGNVTPFAEANVHNDPEAAAIVFDAAWPLTIVPLDVTMQHALTADHARTVGSIGGSVPDMLERMLETYLDYYESIYDRRQCALHDPLAAMMLVPAMTMTQQLSPAGIDVASEGFERGRTLALGDAPGASACTVVLAVEGEAADVLLDRLARHSWPE